jgi:hypothetical protein
VGSTHDDGAVLPRFWGGAAPSVSVVEQT